MQIPIPELEKQSAEAREKLADVKRREQQAQKGKRTLEEKAARLRTAQHDDLVAAELNGHKADASYAERVEQAEAAVREIEKHIAVIGSAVEAQTSIVDKLDAELQSRRHESYLLDAVPAGIALNRALLQALEAAEEWAKIGVEHRAEGYQQAHSIWEWDPHNELGLNWMRERWIQAVNNLLQTVHFARHGCTLPIAKWGMRR